MVSFVAWVDGSDICVSVRIDGVEVSHVPLRMTLDQWHRLRALTLQEDDVPFWAATVEEYEEGVGEPAAGKAAG